VSAAAIAVLVAIRIIRAQATVVSIRQICAIGSREQA
jgi:hypothetical protein